VRRQRSRQVVAAAGVPAVVNEAVGTATWTGTPLSPLLASAELGNDVVELVFTGADRGVQGGVEHD
jgi:sulfane dehydrogenase subunit SoxC